MAEKIVFKISPAKIGMASLDLLIEVHALLQTTMQYVAVQEAGRSKISEDEAMKEINEVYQRMRTEKLMKMISDYGEPDVNLGPLTGA